MINVTKPYLPDRRKYEAYVKGIFDRDHLTNNGPLVRELEERLADYLGVDNVVLTANGTMALQLCIKLFNLSGKVLTTPFSFVATTSALVWEGLTPEFVDIDRYSFNIDPDVLYAKDFNQVSAVLPVHVFGSPCDHHKIEKLALRNNVPVIYDASHAFGVKVKGESVLQYGDASTLSFHATKIFHCIEGGAVILKSKEQADETRCLANFGFKNGKICGLGINAKMNEFQAAMGLCLLDDISNILEYYRLSWDRYARALGDYFQLQSWPCDSNSNGHYFPVMMGSETQVEKVMKELALVGVNARRYFYPSLNKLPYLAQAATCCPISESVSKRIICLPQYYGISAADQSMIVEIVLRAQS